MAGVVGIFNKMQNKTKIVQNWKTTVYLDWNQKLQENYQNQVFKTVIIIELIHQ